MVKRSNVVFDFNSCRFKSVKFCKAKTINDIEQLPYMQIKNPSARPGLVLGYTSPYPTNHT